MTVRLGPAANRASQHSGANYKHHRFLIFKDKNLTLGSDEQLLLHFVTVGIPEVSPRQGSATARVVDDLLDDSLDVSMPAKWKRHNDECVNQV